MIVVFVLFQHWLMDGDIFWAYGGSRKRKYKWLVSPASVGKCGKNSTCAIKSSSSGQMLQFYQPWNGCKGKRSQRTMVMWEHEQDELLCWSWGSVMTVTFTHVFFQSVCVWERRRGVVWAFASFPELVIIILIMSCNTHTWKMLDLHDRYPILLVIDAQ